MKENHTTILLTRENIEKQLWQHSAIDYKKAVIEVILTVVLCVPMTFLMYFIVKTNNHRLFVDIVCMLLPILPILIVLYRSYRAFIERTCLQRGAFDVIQSSLYYKDEKYIRRRNRYELVRLFYFESYPPCEVGHTAYQLASAGDPYILVLYRSKKPYVKLFYAVKMYDYQEK